jgi:hypothetical protein
MRLMSALVDLLESIADRTATLADAVVACAVAIAALTCSGLCGAVWQAQSMHRASRIRLFFSVVIFVSAVNVRVDNTLTERD